MPRILFLTLHRKNRSPGQRFRHEQYLDYLSQNGFEITYAPMLGPTQDRAFYAPGGLWRKVRIGMQALMKRVGNVVQARSFDYIFIYRDAFFFGTFIEWLLRQSKAQLIFDFDDAIWLRDKNPAQSVFQKLKNPSKTGKIISYCNVIIAGNAYLADYARNHNDHVRIIPTTIDTDLYISAPKKKAAKKICIGWSGSFSTIKHFESALAPLYRLKETYEDAIYFKVIGDQNYVNPKLDLKGISWNAETEITDLQEIDIGIMPLPDDEWSRGKCGLKGLQYMALEIPTVMSPVGVNKNIIADGVNGFLADTEEAWVKKLSMLIEDRALRKRLGQAGRKTVEQSYSVAAHKENWLRVFQ